LEFDLSMFGNGPHRIPNTMAFGVISGNGLDIFSP